MKIKANQRIIFTIGILAVVVYNYRISGYIFRTTALRKGIKLDIALTVA